MRCLVTALGSMSAEVVLRAIRRLPVEGVIGCNMHPRAWTAAARLVENFYQVPPALHKDAYVARLLDVCAQEKISHVIPLTDPEVDVLSEFRKSFESRNIALCISSPSALRIARHKLFLHDFFSGNPRIQPIPTFDLQCGDHAGAIFPMLAKPSRGRSSEGLVKIADPMELDFWRKKLGGQDYVLQPFYEGEVIVVDVVRQAAANCGSKSAAMARKELLRSSNGAGMTVRMLPGHRCEAQAVEVAEALKFLGCVNVEFLLHGSMPLLMDVNPRFSAGVGFSALAGYDMVINHLRCFMGIQIELCKPPPNRVYTRRTIEVSLEDQ